jgi:ankyrin repeat protein
MYFNRALQAASQNGHLEVIKVLLRYKADVEIEVSAHSSSFTLECIGVLFIVWLATLTFLCICVRMSKAHQKKLMRSFQLQVSWPNLLPT